MINIQDGSEVTNNQNMKISAPWITYYRQVEALFEKDPAIQVKYDEDDLVIRLYVDGTDKADALTALLPSKVPFGNVVVTVSVIPSNNKSSRIDLIKKAFEGNPIFAYGTTIEGVTTNPISYAVFEPEVCQFWNDNLHDPHGLVSDLYENVARSVIGEGEGIFFTTDAKEPVAIG